MMFVNIYIYIFVVILYLYFNIHSVIFIFISTVTDAPSRSVLADKIITSCKYAGSFFHVIFKSNINFYSRLCLVVNSAAARRQRGRGRRWLVCFPAQSLCLPLSSSSSSLRLSLLSLSLSLWQTEGWWVCCRSNSSIQPRSVGAGSFARWRHTNTTVFPRRDDLVVSVRKQNEARQHEHPPPSLPPPSSILHPPSSVLPPSVLLSVPHPSVCPPCSLACWLHTAAEKTTDE